MIPPWQNLPHISNGRIGWRVGAGEDYAREFYRWFRAQDQRAQRQYTLDNPEPAEWRGYYHQVKAD